jgi:hypothetical protein
MVSSDPRLICQLVFVTLKSFPIRKSKIPDKEVSFFTSFAVGQVKSGGDGTEIVCYDFGSEVGSIPVRFEVIGSEEDGFSR